jgi:bifunctional dethiobiotin synthetase / adenosylmethionine---8-amino-7-oxononanoate aminotransferase
MPLFLRHATGLAAGLRCTGCLAHRLLSTSFSLPSHLPPPVFQVVGAGTGVGKTVLSAALVRVAAGSQAEKLRPTYIKPVQSGYPEDNDCAFVLSHAPSAYATTIVKLSAPASPDLAARLEPDVPPCSDENLCHQITGHLASATESRSPFVVVEGAGGVLSPAPSGSLQADAFRPIRLPSILVGDPRLGGVSNTLAALEALQIRGYDVPVVVLYENHQDENLENAAAIARHASSSSTSVFSAPPLPPADQPLHDYFADPESQQFYLNLLGHLRFWHETRMSKLRDMSTRASSVFWYPFTQHASSSSSVTAIDSAHGLTFSAMHPDHAGGQLAPVTDAIGSWWTTGVGHGHPGVSKAMGAAAGRYGHVMFPDCAHEPAWLLANELLNTGPGNGWASRVFFTDNGSTAVEVSLKMAFRKRSVDVPDRAHLPMRVIALDGCYHGDTLGAMDCAPASDFNSRQTPWYKDKGVFFDPPTVAIVQGVWTRRVPVDHGGEHASKTSAATFASLNDIFSSERMGKEYDSTIAERLECTAARNEFDFGALLLEPVLQGSGGMRLIDPAFQRALVRVCRQKNIPVVFDEVFTGIWRLGAQCAADLLDVKPDIASYAKLLTGGTVPLAVTLATEDVFNAFLGESKRDALLHGHSFTGHAIGCAAAVESLATYRKAELFDANANRFGEFWDEGLARELSCMYGVESSTVIGTVLSVELSTSSGTDGYSSTAGRRIAAALLRHGVFSRPLGNVIYLMCPPVASRHECKSLGAVLCAVLEHELNPVEIEESATPL